MFKKESLSFAKTLIAALFCAALIRSFLFEPFYIPSGSMKPNLLVGDYLIVTKYSYGYSRYSFPFALDLFEGRIFDKSASKKPHLGDIAVFRFPPDPSINYIKRIIGLPGDKIQMRDGVLYINDQKVKKSADGEFSDVQNDGPAATVSKFLETLPNGQEISTLDIYEDAPQDNTGIYEVPAGNYFVMGDNRDNSQDSRFLSEVGFVPEENLIGKARFIFFSSEKPIWQFWKLHDSVRFSRIFKKL